MARHRVEFRLSMPGVASWDGRWSGEGKSYLCWRTLGDADLAALGAAMRWVHAFGDGWCASVSARVMAKGERRAKSAGFCGYDWMVDRIVRWGDTTCRCQWRPMAVPPSGREGAWEECPLCRTWRETDESKVARELMGKEEV